MFLGPLALVGGFFTIVPPGNPREQYGGGSLKKLKIELSCDPAIPLPGIYPMKAIIQKDTCNLGFPGISVVKRLPANAGDLRDAGLIPRWGKSPGGGHSNPL